MASDAQRPSLLSPGVHPAKGAGCLYSSVPTHDPASLPFLQASVGSKGSPCHPNCRAEGQKNMLGVGAGRSRMDHSESLTLLSKHLEGGGPSLPSFSKS